jgi:hypothetical protein
MLCGIEPPREFEPHQIDTKRPRFQPSRRVENAADASTMVKEMITHVQDAIHLGISAP